MSRIPNGLCRLYLLTILLMAGFILSACGGSDPAGAPQQTPSNQWDSLKWDQSSWG